MSLKSKIMLWISKAFSYKFVLALMFIAVALGIKTVAAAITNEPQPLGDPFDDDENFL